MQKYLIKLKSRVALPIIFLFLFVTVAGNVFFFVLQDTIMDKVNKTLPYTISIENIFFMFPNTIILTDVSLQERASSARGSPFVMPRMDMKFSLLNLLAARQLSVTDIVLHKTRLNYHEFSAFLRENFETLIAIFRKFPKKDIKFYIKGALLDLAPPGYHPNDVSADLAFRLKDGVISGEGMLRKDKYLLPAGGKDKPRYAPKKSLMRFSFMGFLTPDGFALNSLVFKNNNCYSNLWGEVKGENLFLKGFAFLNAETQGEKPSSQPHDVSGQELYLVDIDCRARIQFPQVAIESLTFRANDAPVRIKGNLVFSEKLSLEMAASFYPATTGVHRIEDLEHADLKISGALQPYAFDSSGNLSFYFLKRRNSAHPLERIAFNFTNLAFTLDGQAVLKTYLGAGEISFWANGNAHKILLGNSRSTVNLRDDEFKVIQIYSPFYGGTLQGKVLLDVARFPLRVLSSITLHDVDANRLDGMLVHFSKIKGNLSGEIEFKNYPELDITGTMNIKKGTLTDFEFFAWLAESFDLPSLKVIDFPLASARFLVNWRRAELYAIHLESETMTLGGNFSIDAEGLVSSKLSLAFYRDLLRESRKFRPILKMFEKDVPFLNFEFRLSGDQNAMNFQWLPSDVKTRIQARIPDFIERKIERNVDSSLEPAR